jgi:hypothetical protein
LACPWPGLFGSLANLQPETSSPQPNASYAPASRPFVWPEPIAYRAGDPFIPASRGRTLNSYAFNDPRDQTDIMGLSSDFAANRGSGGGPLNPPSENLGGGGTSDIGNGAAAPMAGGNSGLGGNPGGFVPGDQLAQVFIFGLPPSFLLSEPPVKFGPTPEGLTPLEELPPGSAGGVTAGGRFRGPNPYPEGTPCTYCRQPTTNEPGRPNSVESDHKIAKSQGGNAEETNRVPACRTCNRSKGARTPEEWYRWYIHRNNTKEVVTDE